MTTEIVDKSLYVLPNDQPFAKLDVTAAFNSLSSQEKLYAHYLSQASWTGGLITFLQTSPEAGPIFVLFHKLFTAQPCSEFTKAALEAGFSENEIKALYVYCSGVFANAGNYKGFGDTKIIPNIDLPRLESLIKVSLVWSEIEPLWIKIKDVICDLGPGKTSLGYSPQGTTTYFSKNVTHADVDLVQNWMKSKQIECYNNRLFKYEQNNKTIYEIRLASEIEKVGEVFEDGNIIYKVTYGDYSPLMGLVSKYLNEAVKYAANDTEKKMLQNYASSFSTGSLSDHKTGSRYWIKDKSPVVETYIGFIETYRDPAGGRGEFEGFVAVVNKEMSIKFQTLVTNSEQFLKLLPWKKDFEKDVFLRPDFTSLDVLTFAGSGIPAGINIPNYDDIRQSEGFKNVSLGNVIPASYQQTVTPFLTQEDSELLQKWRIAAFELQVGLHELLGHGSGKLLRIESDGTTNFPSTVINPLTGKPPEPCYKPGDTYDVTFGRLSSSYEECRAEAVGLFLSTEPEVLKIFGYEGADAEMITYVNWLSLIWAGAGKGLELWEPKAGWLQAHAQARYVLSRVLIKAGLVKVTQPTENDLLITLDRSAIKTVGRKAIGQFLLELQIYKSTADVTAAEKLYDSYSTVDEPWLSWRSIVLANKQPRKMFVQVNTEVKDGTIKLKEYETSMEGMIQSWIERFPDRNFIYKALLDETEKNTQHF